MKLTIETEADNNMLLAAVNAVMERGQANNTPDEIAFLKWIAPIIQEWEQKYYGPIDDEEEQDSTGEK